MEKRQQALQLHTHAHTYVLSEWNIQHMDMITATTAVTTNRHVKGAKVAQTKMENVSVVGYTKIYNVT